MPGGHMGLQLRATVQAMPEWGNLLGIVRDIFKFGLIEFLP
jgi:hypothetical protein